MLNVTVHLHNGVKIAPAGVVSFTDTTVTVRDQWGESEMQRSAIERVTTPLGAPLTLEQANSPLTPMNVTRTNDRSAVYAVAIRGMNYVIVDTRTGAVQKPAYITRTKAMTACAAMNQGEEN